MGKAVSSKLLKSQHHLKNTYVSKIEFIFLGWPVKYRYSYLFLQNIKSDILEIAMCYRSQIIVVLR